MVLHVISCFPDGFYILVCDSLIKSNYMYHDIFLVLIKYFRDQLDTLHHHREKYCTKVESVGFFFIGEREKEPPPYDLISSLSLALQLYYI